MMFFDENDMESIVSPCCAICCEEFKVGDVVKQIIIGQLETTEDYLSPDGNNLLKELSGEVVPRMTRFCINKGKVADIHVKCDTI